MSYATLPGESAPYAPLNDPPPSRSSELEVKTSSPLRGVRAVKVIAAVALVLGLAGVALGLTNLFVPTAPITGSDISWYAISGHHIEDDAIQPWHLANGAVDTSALSPNSVTYDKIQDQSVTSTKLATAAVTSSKIADRSVTTSKIADQAVDYFAIAYDAVSSAHVADFIYLGAPRLANSFAYDYGYDGILYVNYYTNDYDSVIIRPAQTWTYADIGTSSYHFRHGYFDDVMYKALLMPVSSRAKLLNDSAATTATVDGRGAVRALRALTVYSDAHGHPVFTYEDVAAAIPHAVRTEKRLEEAHDAEAERARRRSEDKAPKSPATVEQMQLTTDTPKGGAVVEEPELHYVDKNAIYDVALVALQEALADNEALKEKMALVEAESLALKQRLARLEAAFARIEQGIGSDA